MSPLHRIASPRHRRHVLLPMDRRPILHSTAVAIDLAAIAALPSPSSSALFSVDIDLAAVAALPSSSTAAPFSNMPVPLASPCIRCPLLQRIGSRRSPSRHHPSRVDLLRVPLWQPPPWLVVRSVCKMVACAKGIRMPAKGLSVFRADKTGKKLAEVLLKGLQGSRPVTLIGFSLGLYILGPI
uniref:Uncharacterized protein n=1 Tax=Oryza meridionalis TaxID=40149 RepID=A0A0E0DPX5_9ORYZ